MVWSLTSLVPLSHVLLAKLESFWITLIQYVLSVKLLLTVFENNWLLNKYVKEFLDKNI